MQYLNDENMEELFREAAENYPLKVTGADWDKVQAALPKKDEPPAGAAQGRKKMLWLLSLLLIPVLCNIFNKKDNIENNHTAGNNIVRTETARKTMQPNTQNNTAQNNTAPNNPSPDNPAYNSLNMIRPKTDPTDISFSAQQKAAIIKAVITGNSNKNKTAGDMNRIVSANKNSFFQKAKSDMQITRADAVSDAGQNISAVPEPDKKITDTAKRKPFTDFVTEDKKKQNDSSKTAQKEKIKKQQQPAKFYVSILGGPDMSKVKNQNVKKIGLSTGLSVGYNINKHIAVEAGAFYSEKHYKSDYKYFNNSKTQWPTGATVTNLEGTCKMIEIPVTARYNFNIQKKNKLFAAAGLSSYIMKKEDYGYNYSGYGYSGYADKAYKNSSKNWLSVLQLSAGWQRNIGKKAAVRVQPYYNVPLKGLGIGSLPISGAGVLAGITFGIR